MSLFYLFIYLFFYLINYFCYLLLIFISLLSHSYVLQDHVTVWNGKKVVVYELQPLIRVAGDSHPTCHPMCHTHTHTHTP